MAKSNPNKVNQYTPPDPRQSLFIKYYFDPKSQTFSNAYQSAKRAGYEEEYSQSITIKGTQWLAEAVGRREERFVNKAESNLEEFLGMDTMNIDPKEGREFNDTGLVRIKADVTKFTLSTLAKNRYAERKELTARDGEALFDEAQGKKILQALE